MPQFVLIDHSLVEVGGHHFDNAMTLLHAAESAGFEGVLATNQSFRDDEQLPSRWRVVRPFPNSVYTSLAAISLATPAAEPASMGTRTWWTPWSVIRDSQRAWRRARRRRRYIRQFAQACRQVFEQISLRPGDQVFLPTVNDIDLLGLARFLRANPLTRAVHWHLQFHFPFLSGRQPDWDCQTARLELVRKRFQQARRGLSEHQVHYYATTRELTEQYELLDVGRFPALPYPLQLEFQRPDHRRPARQPPPVAPPLRLLSAGGIRAEKGQHLLQPLVGDLWNDLFATGKLQLQVQSGPNPPALQFPPEQPDDDLEANHPASPESHERRRSACTFLPHPLPRDQYVRLIRSADIGLLLYDAEAYYARRAGILGELLCCGVPVIVPGGCWLAEQIAESVYGHLDEIARRLPLLDECTGPAESAWVRSCSFGGAGQERSMDVPVPDAAGQLLLAFRRPASTPAGTFVRLDCQQLGEEGQTISSSVEVFGRRNEEAPLPLLIHLDEGVRRLRLQWRNAYHDSQLQLTDLCLRSVRGSRKPAERIPLGAVGLIAATPHEAARLVREMVARYPHYRRTALAFARRHATQHDPARAVQGLLCQASGRPWRISDAA